MSVNNDNRVIDVDKAIEAYNKNNPKLKPLSRKELAKKIGVNPQVFSDWKNGKTPKLIARLFNISEMTGMDLKDFIQDEN